MSDKTYPVPGEWKSRAYVDDAKYRAMYARSLADPNGFWAEQAKRIAWIKAPTKIKNTTFPGNVSIKWFEDGTLNVAYNCLDRHLAKRGDQAAIIWEGDDPDDSKRITYRQLHDQVCRFANVLRKARRQEGRPRHDLYADGPGRPAVAMLACAHRRDPFGRVRRLLAGQSREPHPGLRLQNLDHRRRGPPRRAQGAAEGQRR